MGSASKSEQWAKSLTHPEDRARETMIIAIIKIAESVGFECEDNTSGVDLRFGYRDEDDIAEEAPSLAVRKMARDVKKAMIAAYPGSTVEIEYVDEWISMLVTLPGHKPAPKYGSPEYWARERERQTVKP